MASNPKDALELLREDVGRQLLAGGLDLFGRDVGVLQRGGPEALPVRVLSRVPAGKQRHEPVPPALRGPEEQGPPPHIYQRRPDRRLPDIKQVLGNPRLVDNGQRVFTTTSRVLGVQGPDFDDPTRDQLHPLVLLVLPRHDGLEPLTQLPPRF